MSLPSDDNNNNKEIMVRNFNFNFNNTNINNHQPIFNPKPTTPRVTYRECLKNHAASMGGTVTDGCGEFMPAGEDGTLEALKCAACNCHRNFHRRETTVQQHSHSHPLKQIGFGTESSSEELNFVGGSYNHLSAKKKRFRTKFTTEQKKKMMAFAEKLGWRIPREDDSEMQRFCGEVGVKRQVFKVWMHNNNNSKNGNAKKNGDQEFN